MRNRIIIFALTCFAVNYPAAAHGASCTTTPVTVSLSDAWRSQLASGDRKLIGVLDPKAVRQVGIEADQKRVSIWAPYSADCPATIIYLTEADLNSEGVFLVKTGDKQSRDPLTGKDNDAALIAKQGCPVGVGIAETLALYTSATLAPQALPLREKVFLDLFDQFAAKKKKLIAATVRSEQMFQRSRIN